MSHGTDLLLLRHSTTDWPIVNSLSEGSMAIIRLHHVQFGELQSSNLRVLRC